MRTRVTVPTNSESTVPYQMYVTNFLLWMMIEGVALRRNEIKSMFVNELYREEN
jgi:hypothetical protein